MQLSSMPDRQFCELWGPVKWAARHPMPVIYNMEEPAIFSPVNGLTNPANPPVLTMR